MKRRKGKLRPTANNPKDRLTCGAKAKTTGRPCRLPAGYATDHPGRGRCKFHGGASHGAPKGNRNAQTHGLGSMRLRLRELRREIENRLLAAAGDRDPLSARQLAEDLAGDARRLLARLEQVEVRIESLSADGRLSPAAESEGMRLLVSFERALTGIRSVWTGLVGKFATYDEDDNGETLLSLPAGANVIVVNPGDPPAVGPSQEVDDDGTEN